MSNLLQELGLPQNLSPVLLVWALLMARVLPLIVLAPFIGGDLVPQQVKLGVGIALSLIIYPFVGDTPIPPGAITFVLLLLKEIFVGTAIAFAASMAFEAAQAAGTFVDTVSGANMATVFVPQIQQQATLFASLKFQLTVVLFLALDGHHLVIRALVESFQVVPLQHWPKFSSGFWPYFEMVIRMAADFLLIGVAVAAPAAIATFVTDLSLGIVNRVAPQIQVFFISMSVKPMIVTVMTLASLLVLLEVFREAFERTIVHVRQTIHLFS